MRPLNKIYFLLGYWLLWIGLFEAGRALFVTYNFAFRGEAGFMDVLPAFWNGLRMDISAAAYILAPCSLVMIGSEWLGKKSLQRFFKFYSFIVLIPVWLVIVCDLPAYRAWGYRLDATPLKYLKNPSEAWASISHLPLLTLAAITLIAYVLLAGLFSFYIKRNSVLLEKNNQPLLTSLIFLLFATFLVIPVRGGLQLAPLNQSSVYKSRHQFVNICSLNAPWNFLNSLSNGISEDENPFAVLSDKEAEMIRNGLYEETGEQKFLIDSSIKKPNIIIITWESFTAKSLHLEKSGVAVVPGFEQLISEGLYFPQVYATGDRTEKGVLGILSGYPSLPTVNMMRIPEKHGKLKTLPELFLKSGYQTMFYYGGEIEFANMKSYLLKAGFQKLTEKSDFDDSQLNSKWGAHDHVVLERIKKDLDTVTGAFFLNWLTLSSHEPFETGMQASIPGTDDESLFLNSLHYTDSVIFNLVQYCRSKPWWDNTLVIIVADHGHRIPYTAKKSDDFKIPMLWTGGAISTKGTKCNKLMNQTDLAATLAGQLKMNYDFPWSRNIARDSVPAWAYFTFNNGFGWVEPDGRIIYDNAGKRAIQSEGAIKEEVIKKGFSMQQLTYDDFLGRNKK